MPDPPSNFCASHISSEAAAFSWSPRNDTILSCYPNNSNVLVFIDDFGSSTASTETPAVFQPYTEYTCDASTKCTEHTCEGSTECTGGDQCAGASTSLHFRTCEAGEPIKAQGCIRMVFVICHTIVCYILMQYVHFFIIIFCLFVIKQ